MNSHIDSYLNGSSKYVFSSFESFSLAILFFRQAQFYKLTNYFELETKISDHVIFSDNLCILLQKI